MKYDNRSNETTQNRDDQLIYKINVQCDQMVERKNWAGQQIFGPG